MNENRRKPIFCCLDALNLNGVLIMFLVYVQ